jgi:hypothetical protein
VLRAGVLGGRSVVGVGFDPRLAGSDGLGSQGGSDRVQVD